jgi:hypothetical protein
MISAFLLDPDQVPQPPVSDCEADKLRWMICVMDPGDESLGSVSSLLSYLLGRGGLTERQSVHFEKNWQRVHQRYSLNFLQCQEDQG